MLGLQQKRAALGMIAAALVTVCLAGAAMTWGGFPQRPVDAGARVTLWAAASALPACCVFFAIARLARHRFFTPEDIASSGLNTGTPKARSLQAQLQNTLEQAVLAVIAYGAWLALMPPRWGVLVAAFALCFAIGRLCFFAGYERGAPARAFGFALTFYPGALMMLALLWPALTRLYRALLSSEVGT
jgi:uncharacterized membrane protein YecN with MAPEG domain